MAYTKRLRHSDVRAMLKLVGELLEFRDDREAFTQHALQRLCEMTRASVGIWVVTENLDSAKQWTPSFVWHYGCAEPGMRELLKKYLRAKRDDPMQVILDAPRSLVTRSR